MTKTKEEQRGENTASQIEFFMTLKLRTKILIIILIGAHKKAKSLSIDKAWLVSVECYSSINQNSCTLK